MTQPDYVYECSVCNDPIELRPQNPYFPFCSARCRQVDLGRWLNEDYKLSVQAEETERDMPSVGDEHQVDDSSR